MNCSDQDILLRRGGVVSQRPANKEYHEILKSNVMMYKGLPKEGRAQFATNIFRFIHDVVGRRFVQFDHETGSYQELQETEASVKISAAIRDDKISRAANKSNPRWILGVHDPTGTHNGQPFVHRIEANNTWRRLSSNETDQVLITEGFQNLLILPEGVKLPPSLETRSSDYASAVSASVVNPFTNDDCFFIPKDRPSRRSPMCTVSQQVALELGFQDAESFQRALSLLMGNQQQAKAFMRSRSKVTHPVPTVPSYVEFISDADSSMTEDSDAASTSIEPHPWKRTRICSVDDLDLDKVHALAGQALAPSDESSLRDFLLIDAIELDLLQTFEV
jgi:hypothetical protein